jgi:AcrR family transcriptional regulator
MATSERAARRSPRRVPRRAAPSRPPRAAAAEGSRDRLIAAAASEFARRGFAGANVDRIARAAGVNKAMIYYHFKSKAALYQEILGDMFHAVAGRVRAVAASDAPADEKLKRFVEAIADEAEARPHSPRSGSARLPRAACISARPRSTTSARSCGTWRPFFRKAPEPDGSGG